MFRTLFRSPRSTPHLPDAEVLDALAAAAEATVDDADAALTPERAAGQRAAILARLAGDAESRVLSFPPRPDETGRLEPASTVRAANAPARPALGWLLTAAAAGLVVGVGTGHGIYGELEDPMAPAPVVHVRTAPPPVPVTLELDEQVLGQVDVALARRGVEELRPLDALTPTAVSLLASAGR
jgi:hypothetical protein